MDNYSRILSGMRPTGRLHLGNYHGAIKNWINLQYEHSCYFMAADIHALTTDYENPKNIEANVYEMVIDWLACGIDPAQAVMFVQSHVPEHAELHLLLSMITPLSWLERIPTYRDQIEKLSNKDLGTYGFLGYPLLQSSDILLYNAKYVPVGEDQISHVELTREIARRFNYLYGREEGFEEKALETIKKLGAKKASLYEELLIQYQQEGDEEALEKARYLLKDAINLSSGDVDRLFAFLENKSKVILTEPQELITITSKLPGLDGQKMSKSYNNTITLREDAESITKKIRAMPTDPARIRRTDSGDPEKCPVWQLHKVYSNEEVKLWVQNGCTTAGIGCLDCKQPLIDSIVAEQQQFCANAAPYLEDSNLVRNIVADGAEKATEIARQTLTAVKEAMGL
jgi:tryptophanyl-tRNA synthetase